MELTEELIHVLTPAVYWGKWDVDWEEARALMQVPGFFTPEEETYITLRSQGHSVTDVQKILKRSPRAVYHHQRDVFFKYYYAKFMEHALAHTRHVMSHEEHRLAKGEAHD